MLTKVNCCRTSIGISFIKSDRWQMGYSSRMMDSHMGVPHDQSEQPWKRSHTHHLHIILIRFLSICLKNSHGNMTAMILIDSYLEEGHLKTIFAKRYILSKSTK